MEEEKEMEKKLKDASEKVVLETETRAPRGRKVDRR